MDAILDGAKDAGAEVEKIQLLDRYIEFCTNCRNCTQNSGDKRGQCVLNDDMNDILLKIAAKTVGARPVHSMWVGLIAQTQDQSVSPKTLGKAKIIGARLAV